MSIELKYAIVMMLTKWVSILSLVIFAGFEAGMVVGLTFLLIFINLEFMMGDAEQIIKEIVNKNDDQGS